MKGGEKLAEEKPEALDVYLKKMEELTLALKTLREEIATHPEVQTKITELTGKEKTLVDEINDLSTRLNAKKRELENIRDELKKLKGIGVVVEEVKTIGEERRRGREIVSDEDVLRILPARLKDIAQLYPSKSSGAAGQKVLRMMKEGKIVEKDGVWYPA